MKHIVSMSIGLVHIGHIDTLPAAIRRSSGCVMSGDCISSVGCSRRDDRDPGNADSWPRCRDAKYLGESIIHFKQFEA